MFWHSILKPHIIKTSILIWLWIFGGGYVSPALSQIWLPNVSSNVAQNIAQDVAQNFSQGIDLDSLKKKLDKSPIKQPPPPPPKNRAKVKREKAAGLLADTIAKNKTKNNYIDEGYFYRFDTSYIIPFGLKLQFDTANQDIDNDDDNTTSLNSSITGQTHNYKTIAYSNFMQTVSFGYRWAWGEWDVGFGYYPQWIAWQANATAETDSSEGSLLAHNIPIIGRITFLIPLGVKGLSIGVGSGGGVSIYIGDGTSKEDVMMSGMKRDPETNIIEEINEASRENYHYNLSGLQYFLTQRLSVNYRFNNFGFQIYSDWIYNFNPLKFTANNNNAPNINGTITPDEGIFSIGLSFGQYF
ncbi:MAG: hypothetical protein ACR2NY_03985 [Alphaproteobacteria bacterium]